jgi:hypothetical protein
MVEAVHLLEHFDITSDGVTVWVNGAYGLLGRFGRFGVDVHRPMSEQGNKGECLHCTHTYLGTTLEDWRVFVQKMEEHHGVVVGEQYMPKRFKMDWSKHR